MIDEELKKFLSKHASSEDFFQKACSFAVPLQGEVEKIFDFPREQVYSKLLDEAKLQPSLFFRMRSRALAISQYLIDDKANFLPDALDKLIVFWKEKGNIFYPDGQNDIIFYNHSGLILNRLKDKSFIRQLQQYTLPFCHNKAEEIVRLTLNLKEGVVLTSAHAQRVLLASLLHPLRQSVGSCFATAPAILIQKEQPEIFLEDLQNLLYKGKLTRIINGEEYTVPWNSYWSLWDIQRDLSSYPLFWHSPAFLHACIAMGLIEKQDVLHCLEEVRQKVQNVLPAENLQAVFKKMLQKRYENPDEIAEKEKKGIEAFFSLQENLLVKTWEYTLASFSDVKAEFSNWNLYVSLGFAHSAPFGIGQIAYQTIDNSLARYKKNAEKHEDDYQLSFDQLKATEVLLRQAYRESDIRRLKAEYQVKQYQLQNYLDLRNESYEKAKWYVGLFKFLMEEYQKKLPMFFQEIYDVQMYQQDAYLYEDAPAGFRLVYKHGRSDPSIWTAIHTPQQYIDSLANFFIITEPQIQALFEKDFQKKEVETIITQIVSHIRSDSFLQSAFARLKAAHAKYDIQVKTPWSYVSGGSMFSLLKNYFRRQTDIYAEEGKVENALDLLVFLLDGLKSLTPNITKDFEKNPSKALLMYSPVHAFCLLPGHKEFMRAWQNDLFSYTWARDNLIVPGQSFYQNMQLSSEQQHFLFDLFLEKLPLDVAHYLKRAKAFVSFPCGVKEFHDQIVDCISSNLKLDARQLQTMRDQIDSFLFANLPLTSPQDFITNVRKLLEDFQGSALEAVLENVGTPPMRFITRKELQEWAKIYLVLAKKQIALPFDLHLYVAEKSRQHRLSPPFLIFADTNWPFFYFAFVVSPSFGTLELWRVDSCGLFGYPMSDWKKCFQPEKKSHWGICAAPHEYRF